MFDCRGSMCSTYGWTAQMVLKKSWEALRAGPAQSH